MSAATLLASTAYAQVKLTVTHRPGSAPGSSYTLGRGGPFNVSSANFNYSGTNTTAGTGTMLTTIDGVDLIGDGKTYDVVIGFPLAGENITHVADKKRIQVSSGDTISYAPATIAIYDAGTQNPANLQISVNGYTFTGFGDNDSNDTLEVSGSGFTTFTTTGNATYSATSDLMLRKLGGINNLLTQTATFTINGAAPETTPTMTATMNSASGIDLSWTASVGATSYDVYQNTVDDRATAKRLLKDTTDVSFTDRVDMIDGTTYYYWVIAKNPYDTSDFSTVASALFVETPPESSDGFVLQVLGGDHRARIVPTQDEMESVLNTRFNNELWYEEDGSLETEIPEKMAAGINGFAIITTEEYKNRLTKLDAYMEHKTNQGFRMMVITEKDYDPNGETTGGQPRAYKIRDWLHNNYLDKKLLYVMFIGNPRPKTGDVPMHFARGPGIPNTGIASDYPYVDCSGATWDLNGDGIHGDHARLPAGDYGPGGADFVADVYVGRMLIYGDDSQWASVADMDYLLQRTIDWENDTGDLSWRQDILAANVGSVGDNRYSGIRNSVANYVGAKVTWMTELWGDSVPTTGLTGGKNVVAALNERPYGILHWHGHGTPTSIVGSISSPELRKVTQPKVAGWGWAGGCTIGHPTVEENLTWALVRFATMGFCGASDVISTVNAHTVSGYVGRIYMGQSNGELFWEAYSSHAREPNFTKMSKGNLKLNFYGDPSIVVCPQRRGRPIVLSPNALIELNHQYGVADESEEFDFYFKNNTDVAATFSTSTTQPWLTVSPSSFTLESNETMTLTISCDAMGSLPIGKNRASFTVSSDQGHSETRDVIAEHYLPYTVFYNNCNVPGDLVKETESVASDTGVFGSNGILMYGEKAKFKATPQEVMRKNYAISCWLNVKNLGTADKVFMTKNQAWSFGLVGNKLTLTVGQNVYGGGKWQEVITLQDPAPIPLDQWRHVVLNIDNENHLISMHVDGVKVDEQVMPHKQLGIGTLGNKIMLSHDNGRFKVVLDDLWIIRKYLSQDDIDALGRGGFAQPVSPARGGRSNTETETLIWKANAQAVSYDIYHGSDPAAVAAATTVSPEFVNNKTGLQQVVTSVNGANYWRVDVVTATGVNQGFVRQYTYDASFSNSEPVWSAVTIDDWQVGDDSRNLQLSDWVTDADADAVLTFELLDGPASEWLAFGPDGSMGAPFGPGAGDVGVNTYTVRVTDQWGASAEHTFTINVIN